MVVKIIDTIVVERYDLVAWVVIETNNMDSVYNLKSDLAISWDTNSSDLGVWVVIMEDASTLIDGCSGGDDIVD